MHLNSLEKTQHFPIPLSVTVSKAKKFLVVLFTNDDQTWEVKGEKRTSENRRKINGARLKLQKTETSLENFYLEFFFSRYRNFQTIPSVSLRIAFFTEKIQPLRRSLPHV